VPVGFANLKRDKLAMLPGTTRLLQVELLPKPSGAFAHVKGFSFPVSFPKGLCAAAAVSSTPPPAMPTGVASAPKTPRPPTSQKPETTPGPAPPPAAAGPLPR
ncbi:MAG: hypothetical protein ACREK4_24250, partial [Candidatus Rokuibacteriota bacterium]